MSTEIGQTKHDARQGFHDVKPLPEDKASMFYEIMGVLVAGLLIALLFLRRKREEIVPRSAAKLRDYAAELSELRRRLASGDRAFRAIANSVSEILRARLETWGNFPALELTPRELDHELKRLGTLPSETQKEIIDAVRDCERISFADQDQSDQTELLRAIDRAERALRNLRTAGVHAEAS